MLFYSGAHTAGLILVLIPLAYLILLVFLLAKGSSGAKVVYSIVLVVFYAMQS